MNFLPHGAPAFLPGRFLLLIPLLAVIGCASTQPLLTSLEDLTSETQSTGLSSANQNRILSMTGLLPHVQVGSSYFYDGDRAPSTAIGLADQTSFLIESKIPGPEDPETIDKVLEKITEVRSKGRVSLQSLVDSIEDRAILAEAEDQDPAPSNLETLRSNAESSRDLYLTNRGAFDTALEEASRLLVDSGFVVIRWDTERQEGGEFSIGSLLGLSAAESKRSSGFAILSGLRLITLFVGSDIHDRKEPVKRSWSLVGRDFPWIFTAEFPFIGQWGSQDARLTTHLLQTQKIQFFQDVDLQSELSVAIEATYAELSDLGEVLEEAESIEAEYISRGIASLSNLGSFAGIERRFYPSPLGGNGKRDVKKVEQDLAWFHRNGEGNWDSSFDGYLQEKHGDGKQGLWGSMEDLEGQCLRFTGQCIEDQLRRDLWQGKSALAPEMDGWLTIYAVDVDTRGLRKRIRKL